MVRRSTLDGCLRGLFESTCHRHRETNENHHPDDHHHALKKVGPHRSQETTDQRVTDNGHSKDHQSHIVFSIDWLLGVRLLCRRRINFCLNSAGGRIVKFLRQREDAVWPRMFHDGCPGLKLSRHREGKKGNNHD